MGESEMTVRSGEVIFSEQGISYTIPESISLFGFSISFYGLFLALAVLVGIFVVLAEVKRKQQDIEWNITLITLVIVAALFGARIYYVLFQWRFFVENPVALVNFRGGGLSYFGALFGAWFVVKWYCRRKGGDFIQSADCLAFGAATIAPIVWLGCAMVREPVGRFYEGIFSVRIPRDNVSFGYMDSVFSRELLKNIHTVGNVEYVTVHPVAIYGMVCSVFVFGILAVLKRFMKQSGGMFSLYLCLNAVMCFGLELFRAERCYIWGTNIPVNCIVATVLVITIVTGWLQQYLKQKKPWEKHL